MTHTFLADGTVTTPVGWRAGVAACGIKYTGRDDLALVVSDTACNTAALFTTNQVQSAHIHYDRSVLQQSRAAIRAVLINTGSANACTGAPGIANAAAAARAVEDALALPANTTLVMSTGVIGLPLPIEKVEAGIAIAANALDANKGIAAARAIMTTDTRPKYCAVRVTMPDGAAIHIGGMIKGAGMIHPNMATMLSVLTTDAAITPAALETLLRDVADRSFHCISVDGDTSTNDTVLLLANGAAHTPIITISDVVSEAGQRIQAALLAVCQHLARELVRDGEGAHRLITITVRGTSTYDEAHRIAMTIATSPLVKTAIFGADPNWGRVVCAAGYSGIHFNPEQMHLWFGDIKVYEHGMPLPFDEDVAHALLNKPDVTIIADMGKEEATEATEATVWTCDFSYEYVKINAEYRT